MEKKKIRIAVAQINTTVGDLAGNSKKIIGFIKEAEEKECDVITFPELATTGYPPEDLLLKPGFIADNIACLKAISKKTEDIVAIVGFVDRKKRALYNAAAVIYKNKIRGIYHKMVLPNYGVFDEKRYFSSGSKYLMVNIDGIYCGINICEDIWEDEPVKKISKLGAKIIFNINASPYHAGKIELRKKMLLKHAREKNIVISYNNLVGGQDELVFDGRSMLMDKRGVFCEAKAFEEDLIIEDLDADNYRNKARVNKSDKSIVWVKLPKKILAKDSQKFSKNSLRSMPVLKEVFLALMLGLKDYVRKNNFKKVVIGLSGGIDSALTAAIATAALGKENVIVVYMPSKFSSSESKNLSLKLAGNLGIGIEEIAIQGIFEYFKDNLKTSFRNKEEGITEENLQARIRGTILMALSNKFGWLVVTTGNKSEMSTGYATLYGDMAGGFALLKDVPKTFVFELAEYFNTLQVKEIIPKGIIERVPTAELRPNQKDSDSLPEYDVLDKIIKFYVEENYSFQKIVSLGFSQEIVKQVIDLIDKAEYKRRQSPPGVKITPRAFGKDRRMPITNKYIEGENC